MTRNLALWLPVFLVFFCPFVATAATGLPTWNEAGQKAWWAKNPTPDLWPQAADAVQAQLEASYKLNGDRAFSDSEFQEWLDHLAWVRLGLACPDDLANPDDLKAFVALGQDEAVSHLFVEKLDPLDDKKQALRILLDLEKAGAADLHEYAALGVAFSLVFDQPFPQDWPHRQVPQSAVPIGDLDAGDRFRFYIKANRDKKLDQDLTQLSFENLKFLVDSKVKLSELSYAEQNRISYSLFYRAFFSIQYAYKRINSTSSVYTWPNTSYTLADIEREGGICIDQAYYAETLGKGRGIPTIRFTGYGMEGAHAWFGYLSSSRKWELDCGRYEEQNYPKGFAVDPQTWQPIDDSVLEYRFKNGAKNSNFQPAMNALAWAQLHANDPSYPAILKDAENIMPEWSGTWRLEAALIDKGTDLDKKKSFYNDWIRQFTNYPELKVEGQKRLYLALKAANDPDANDLLKDIIMQNRNEGFDLGIEAASESLNDQLNALNWDDARMTFERAIRDFGGGGGLTLYMKIVDPYIQACMDNDKLDLADRAVHFTQDRMTIDLDSQVGQAFTKLKNEIISRKHGGH